MTSWLFYGDLVDLVATSYCCFNNTFSNNIYDYKNIFKNNKILDKENKKMKLKNYFCLLVLIVNLLYNYIRNVYQISFERRFDKNEEKNFYD